MQILTETSISAVKALLYLATMAPEDPVAPRQIARQLNLSPTYAAKILRRLVHARILRSHRGARGGVSLNRPVGEITLLEAVESCQGQILAHFCQETKWLARTCAFHQAMADLHDSVTDTLARWSLADLCARPLPTATLRNQVNCRMTKVSVSKST